MIAISGLKLLFEHLEQQILQIEMYEESENEIYFNVCLLKVAACAFDFFQN